MVMIKDKIITAESLLTLHEYNKSTYETKENIENLSNTINDSLNAINDSLNTKFDKPENDIVPIENGGTNASDGATGLANLFASGTTILSSYQYGDELPEAGTVGRIFFKRLTDL